VELLESLFGNLLKSPLSLRNQAADSFFYDVESLEPAEREMLSPLVDVKGTIIVVSPRARGGGIRHYKSALGFMLEEGNTIEVIAVAGVGSSVLGTAALARNVADHFGRDVAGIVTGYGMTDLVLEGMGGWFYYGGIDRLRYSLEQGVDQLFSAQVPPGRPPARADMPQPEDGERGLVPDLGYPMGSFDVLGNSDVRALHDILLAGPPRLRLLIGHSKGNLLISFVLNHMNDELENMTEALHNAHHPLFNGLSVVTLGTVVDIPTATFGLNTYQFLGEIDVLGQLNSDRDFPILGTIAIVHEVVPGAGHHLNPRIPCFLPVNEVLQKVELPSGEVASSRGIEDSGRSRPASWGDWASIIAQGRSRAPSGPAPSVRAQ
jgi:hypothetical protein